MSRSDQPVPWTVPALVVAGAVLSTVVFVTITLWPTHGVVGLASATASILGSSFWVVLPCLAWPLLLTEAGRRHRWKLAAGILAVHLMFLLAIQPLADRERVAITWSGVYGRDHLAAVDPSTWTLWTFLAEWDVAPAVAAHALAARARSVGLVLIALLPFATGRSRAPTAWPPVLTVFCLSATAALRMSSDLGHGAILLAGVGAHLWWPRRASTHGHPAPWVRTAAIGVVLGCLAFGLGASRWIGHRYAAARALTINSKVSAELVALEGGLVRIPDPAGRPTLLVTWAGYCAACTAHFRDLGRMQTQLGEDRASLLALNIVGREDAQQYGEAKVGGAGKVVLNGDPPVRIDPGRVPMSYVIDGHGVVTWLNAGGGGGSTALLEAALKAARTPVLSPVP